jgi:hypothetical protein
MTKDEALELLNNKRDYFAVAYNREDITGKKVGDSAILEALTDKLYDIKKVLVDLHSIDESDSQIGELLTIRVKRLL